MSKGSERPTMYFGTLDAFADMMANERADGPPAGDTVPCGPPDADDEDTGLIESELLERLRDAARRSGGDP